METLRKSFEALHFRDVRTYVQSGNVVFKAGAQSCASLAQTVRNMILRDFGFSVSVLAKTADDLSQAVRHNPFLKEKGIDTTRLHVTFLSAAPQKTALKALEALPSGLDRFRHHGTEIYLHCPNGYGRTKLSNNTLERLLAIEATTRNWNTVTALHRMASE